MCDCHLRAPYLVLGSQSRHLSWLGTKPATLWFAGQRSIHWAIPARADHIFILQHIVLGSGVWKHRSFPVPAGGWLFNASLPTLLRGQEIRVWQLTSGMGQLHLWGHFFLIFSSYHLPHFSPWSPQGRSHPLPESWLAGPGVSGWLVLPWALHFLPLTILAK